GGRSTGSAPAPSPRGRSGAGQKPWGACCRRRGSAFSCASSGGGGPCRRQGGPVQLECGPGAEGRLRVTVADTGPGIVPEAIDQLFVPFERLGGEQTGIEGAGLGLPLSRRLAEAMGGTLEVETTPGQGSRVWVGLPAGAGPGPQRATARGGAL